MEILFQTIKTQKRLPERKDVVEHLQLKALCKDPRSKATRFKREKGNSKKGQVKKGH